MRKKDIEAIESKNESLADGSTIIRTTAITRKVACCCLCGGILPDDKQHGICCNCQQLASLKERGEKYHV